MKPLEDEWSTAEIRNLDLNEADYALPLELSPIYLVFTLILRAGIAVAWVGYAVRRRLRR